MAKATGRNLQRIQDALKLYEEAIAESLMTDKSKATYIRHARHFVRWLDDDFTPGDRLRR